MAPKMVAYHNDKPYAQTFGNRTIMPNETREVDETLLPGYRAKPRPEAAPEPSLVDQLAELNAAALVEQVPELAVSEVNELIELENQRDKPRKTVIAALEARKLELASVDDSVEAYAATLADMSAEELAAELEANAGNAMLQGVVQAEQERRAGDAE